MGVLSLRVLSVNVSKPKLIGERDGEEIISAIDKQPVRTQVIEVGAINLSGDAQANMEKHGGPDKAVYAYPSEHWRWWDKEHRFACGPGTFGENLTLEGADEAIIHIGDRFSWGEVELEVSQPRVPCHKLQFFSRRDEVAPLITTTGRCGWYFRVRKTGTAPVSGAELIRTFEAGGATIRDAHWAAFDRKFDAQRRAEVADLAALSGAWRKRILALA
jgi:MOSC domain-containing protein YiiM